jgi:hypothetical protein
VFKDGCEVYVDHDGVVVKWYMKMTLSW